MPGTHAPLADRILRLSEPEPNSGCRLWFGNTNESGYGCIKHETRTLLAHRAAYATQFGGIPDGLQVLHKCDTPPCVNPEHLFLGTPADNLADCASKGRWGRKGGGSPRLTKEAVTELLSLYHSGESVRSLSRRFGVGTSAIRYHTRRQEAAK